MISVKNIVYGIGVGVLFLGLGVVIFLGMAL